MDGERKFPLAVRAVEQSLKLLHNGDRFSLVVFDEMIDVLMPSTLATSDARKRAIRKLEQVQPRGSTDLCSGWMPGCEQMYEHVAEGTISRALMFTDGQGNNGETHHEGTATKSD